MEAFWLSEMIVEIPCNDPVVPALTSTSTFTLSSYPSASANERDPYESLSEPNSDKRNKTLGWALPGSEKEDGGDKEKVTPTSASTPASLLARTTATTTVWNPSSAFVYNLAFAPASFEARPRPHPVVITGRWVREHRGSWKDYIWVAEDSTAEPQEDGEVDDDKEKVEENIAVMTEEEEEAVRAEVFHADMARVRERGWSWGGGEVLVEEATTTRAAAVTESTGVNIGEGTSLTEVESPPNGPTELDLIAVSTGRWIIPTGSLFLVLLVAVALLAWVLMVRQSSAGHVFWDGLWVVPGAPAWELIAPFEAKLFKAASQVLPMNIGTIMAALFLSVVLTDVCAAAQQGAKKSLGRLFGWTAGAVSGVGVAIRAVMRWRTALRMTTTESKMAFALPGLVTDAEWEEVRIIRAKKSLPIKFVLARDIVPAAEMCPRHELGIGAGIGASGSGTGSSFGLGLFLLGFLVWGSGRRQLRSVGRV